ncbi:hypothetical protein GGE50_006023 [Rhizobium leguminosarum]|nr:hypothetical protein RLV_4380 [Rhizobium leguminosarum bv. viciae]MBB4331560.1 hypothetical protein [Rhizobium leguminosarum]MBB4345452.1 hypothetical protein [Rhizobium leguminosarum]MBB4357161.1 hypothetical protein [Rhizobium leguminosarum]MBB4389455.1 hypothetical protein [Rhizobium leguminosarum]
MFISIREAADLGLQIALVLTLTMSGMAVASYAVRNDRAKISAIDVSRPSLWTAAPMRVDPATQAYLRADASAALEPMVPMTSATTRLASGFPAT